MSMNMEEVNERSRVRRLTDELSSPEKREQRQSRDQRWFASWRDSSNPETLELKRQLEEATTKLNVMEASNALSTSA